MLKLFSHSPRLDQRANKVLCLIQGPNWTCKTTKGEETKQKPEDKLEEKTKSTEPTTTTKVDS